MTRVSVLLLLFLGLIGTAARAERAVTVFSAASLGGALERIAAGYEHEVTVSLGGSGAMARQVAAGAPADLVILASTDWMDWLGVQGVLHPEDTVPLIGNSLVVVAPTGAPRLETADALSAYVGENRLAMGQREAVPAGVYARQWLMGAGLWEGLMPRLTETDNVRAALALVARGEVPAGIVYASDALSEPSVDVILAVPAALHDPIVYPAAALTPAGADFLTYLQSADARGIFAAFGFSEVDP